MFFQQIEPTAMQRHRRRIRQLQSVTRVEFENLMLRCGITAIGFEDHIDRREPLTFLIANRYANFSANAVPGTLSGYAGPPRAPSGGVGEPSN